MAGLIIWIDYRQRRRGGRIRLGGPEPDNGNGERNGNALHEKVASEDEDDGAPVNGYVTGAGDTPDERKDPHYILRGPEREM